jgi:hypothetical protein
LWIEGGLLGTEGGVGAFLGLFLEAHILGKDFRGLCLKGKKKHLLVLALDFKKTLKTADLVSNRVAGHYANI